MRAGDIILFALPQADGKIKLRPVLLLKELPKYSDWLVCGISSQLHQEILGFDLLLYSTHPDFKSSGLLHSGLIRLGFLATVPSKEIAGKIGSISESTLNVLLNRLRDYLIG